MSQDAVLGILENKELWYKYGIDYDKITSEEGDALTNLLQAFSDKGRKNNLGISIDILRRQPATELRKQLDSAYAKWLWGWYKTGESFVVPGGFRGIPSDPANGLIVEPIDDFRIIWTLEPQLIVEGDPDKGTVFGKRLLHAESIIIRITKSMLEVRASKKGLNLIQTKLEDLGAKKIETKEIEREIDKSIEQLLLKGSEHLRVIEVKFLESSLPDKSELLISNDLGIHNDLGILKENGWIPDFSITDVKSFQLKILETGKRFNLKVSLEDEGYVLLIDDKRLDEDERTAIRTLLRKAGIETAVRYKYQVDRNQHTIFHKILSGATRAYDEYFPSLPLNLRENLKHLASLHETRVFTCRNCKRENTESTQCIECGNKDMRENKIRKIVVDKESIVDIVMAHINDIGKTFQIGDVTYSDIKFAEARKEIRCEFTKTDKAGHVARAMWHKFFIVSFGGKEQLSEKYDDHLKSCSLVIYGDAIYKERGINHLGTIDLFRLIDSDKEEKRRLFHEMIRNSLSHIEDRIVPLSSGAVDRLKDDKKLTAKQFERDVFYLVKRMYPMSERVGRIGKRESDGILMFTDSSGQTQLASYDAKHSESLYKLDSSEQDKAVYYILDETMNHDIKLATNGRGISAHIIISNELDAKKLKSFAEGIRRTLKLTKTGDEIKCTIIFLELRELLDLFSVYSEHATVIKGDNIVHKMYLDLTKTLLGSGEGWVKLGKEDIEEFKGKLLQSIQRSPTLPHSI